MIIDFEPASGMDSIVLGFEPGPSASTDPA